MEPERRISQAFIDAHPDDAARRLERFPPAEIAAFLELIPAPTSSALLERMAAPISADCLARLSPPRAHAILARLPVDTAARLLRRLNEEERIGLLTCAPEDVASTLSLLLQFPEDTAGALMDPRVLTVPEDINVRESRLRVRRAAHRVLYYLYVVDRTGALVGVVNLRELLLVPGNEPLTALMRSRVARLSVHADRQAILHHPAWRDVHALPVVDESNVLLGAIRYETLRRLEEELAATPQSQAALGVVLTLGELYWMALGGLVRGLWPAAEFASAQPAEGGKSDGT